MSYRFLNSFSHLVSESQNHILSSVRLAVIPSDFSAARDWTSLPSSPTLSYVFLRITTTLLLACHYVTGLQPAGCWVSHGRSLGSPFQPAFLTLFWRGVPDSESQQLAQGRITSKCQRQYENMPVWFLICLPCFVISIMEKCVCVFF